MTHLHLSLRPFIQPAIQILSPAVLGKQGWIGKFILAPLKPAGGGEESNEMGHQEQLHQGSHRTLRAEGVRLGVVNNAFGQCRGEFPRLKSYF